MRYEPGFYRHPLFEVGEKVSCVRASNGPRTRDPRWGPWPEVGRTYTVRGFVRAPRGDLGVLLEEIVRPFAHHGTRADGTRVEAGFNQGRFAPLRKVEAEKKEREHELA